MMHLVAVELFKLRKRWMPWILLGILIAFMALIHFAGVYSDYVHDRNNPPQSINLGADPGAPGRPRPTDAEIGEVNRRIQESQERELQLAAYTLSFPGGYELSFAVAQSVGRLLLVVLAASVFGAEFAWGTVRLNLVRGVSRNKYLMAKLGALLVVAVLGLIAVFLAATVFTAITSSLVSGGLEVSSSAGKLVGQVLAMFGRTLFALMVPILLAGMVAVITRSSAAGIGVVLAYLLLEAIPTALLSQLGGWPKALTTYFLGHNVTSIMLQNSLTSGSADIAQVTSMGLLPDKDTGFWRSAGILLAYYAAFLAAMFYVFRKRDLTAS